MSPEPCISAAFATLCFYRNNAERKRIISVLSSHRIKSQYGDLVASVVIL